MNNLWLNCYYYNVDLQNKFMTVTYIFHSCYVMEFDSFSLIVDFYRDAKREDGSYWVGDYLLNKPTPLYVLCTHSHPDHFNPDILSWKKRKDNITFIFSKEILQSGKAAVNDALYLDKFAAYSDDNFRVRDFGSTDAGGSFLIEVGEKRIFHAGDLNNWHWVEEVSKEDALVYENNFLCELELLAENVDHLHLAMFPVDPRLGKKYMRGAEQFVRRIQTDVFLPMHFGENYDKANAFGPLAAACNCRFLPVTRRGQSYEL